MSDQYGIEIGKIPKLTQSKPSLLSLVWDDDLQQVNLIALSSIGGGGTGGVDITKKLSGNWDMGPFALTLAGIKGQTNSPLTLYSGGGQGITVNNDTVSLTSGITKFDLNKAQLVNGSGAAVTLGILSVDNTQAKIGDVVVITKAGDMTVNTLTAKGQVAALNSGRIYSPAMPDKSTWPAELIPLPQAVRPLEKSVWLAHSAKPGYGYFVHNDASLLMYAGGGVQLLSDGLIEIMTDTKKDANNNPIRYFYVDADGYLTLGGKGLKTNFVEQTGTGELLAKTLSGDSPTLTFDDTVGTRGTWDIGLKNPFTGSGYLDAVEFHIRTRPTPDLGIGFVASTTGNRVVVKPLRRTTATSPSWSSNTSYQAFLGEPGFPWTGLYVTSTSSYAQTSDVRGKMNIRDTALGLDFILQLRPVDYERVEGGKSEHGFIAQEIEPLGFAGHSVDDDGNHWLHPFNFFAPIVKALQQIDQRLSALEARP
jgi:hypothetical protein